MSPPEIPAYFSPADLAARLSLHPETIYRAIRAGQMPEAVFIGRVWRIPAAAVAAWLDERRPHRAPTRARR